MDKELKNILFEKGIDIVRFVDISELSTNQTQGFNKAIIFFLKLSRQFIKDVNNNAPLTNDEFLDKERKVDELAEWLAIYIQQKGYNAYAQSEKNNLQNGNFDTRTQSSILPNKTIALLGGLGFIGKNNLLITQKYGCAFCMCAVLTDAPIHSKKYLPITSKCGNCNICKEICLAKAIRGNEWTQNGGRESLVDISKCCCALKCMIACPWTLKYARETT